jgi:hypothetical protein
MEALKSGDLRLLADILSEVGHQLEVNMEYETENYKTLIQVQTTWSNCIVGIPFFLR